MLELILREWRLLVHERPSVMFVVGLRVFCLRVVDWRNIFSVGIYRGETLCWN